MPVFGARRPGAVDAAAFSDHEGHLAGYHREGEILDELLARG
jgi:hypothetical protein